MASKNRIKPIRLINMKTKSHPTDEIHQIDPSIMDLRLSWQYLLRNFGAFFNTSLFALISSLILSIIMGVFSTMILIGIFGTTIVEEPRFQVVISLILMPVLLVFSYAFYGSTYGLAFDIMSSGFEFTRMRNAFGYFVRFWWEYALLSIIGNLPSLIYATQINVVEPGWSKFFLSLFLSGLTIITNILFFLTMPSVTSQGSFKRSFKENFFLLRSHPKRILKSYGLYYLIFNIPNLFIYAFFYAFASTPFSGPLYYILILLMGISAFFAYAFSQPMCALVATRIYNSYITKNDKIEIKKIF